MPCKQHAPKTPEHRAKISLTLSGRVLSLEHKIKLSKAARGKKLPIRSLEHCAKLSAWAKGRVLSDEHKSSISQGVKASYERDPQLAQRRIDVLWQIRGPTSLEYALQMLLESAEFKYEAQTRFENRVVDFWVPSHKLVFEADGVFWHQDKERETLRDQYLQERGALAVIHLDDTDLNQWRK